MNANNQLRAPANNGGRWTALYSLVVSEARHLAALCSICTVDSACVLPIPVLSKLYFCGMQCPANANIRPFDETMEEQACGNRCLLAKTSVPRPVQAFMHSVSARDKRSVLLVQIRYNFIPCAAFACEVIICPIFTFTSKYLETQLWNCKGDLLDVVPSLPWVFPLFFTCPFQVPPSHSRLVSFLSVVPT
ncbi:hypothetical protein BC832DRAFT_37433 [Gaertneriomyces semiglobifer]|nr:hypothetical protein BC832DRAFT_37433 [Gaertneriomyces semiglobifer]